ncbi:amidohydrolase [Atractiella rhizophila]|nr:amidohydrolase [Atractiella rhizophila]
MPSCFSAFRRSSSLPSLDEKAAPEEPPSYTPKIYETLSPLGQVEALEKAVDQLSPALRNLSLKIHGYKETRWQERKTAKAMVEFMKKQVGNKKGYTITTGTGGLETAWKVVYKSDALPTEGGKGGRVGFNSEMDALPGIGHACGHNLIAIVGVGAFLALSSTMARFGVPGSCILLGTPAEEGGGGKVKLLERGEYEDMDLCLMAHPGQGDPKVAGIGGSLAVATLVSNFTGHTAHAALAPWEGVNALDAAVTTYNSLAMLRQQLPPTHRVHSVIKSPEGAPFVQNIIPGKARIDIGMRAPTWKELEKLKAKVEGCVKAGENGSGCQVESRWAMQYKDTKLNYTLCEEYKAYLAARHDIPVSITTEGSASTDFGDVSYALPGLQAGFLIPAKAANHTPEFAEAAKSVEAHQSAVIAMKGLAAVGWKAVKEDQWRERVKEEFERKEVEIMEQSVADQKDLKATKSGGRSMFGMRRKS